MKVELPTTKRSLQRGLAPPVHQCFCPVMTRSSPRSTRAGRFVSVTVSFRAGSRADYDAAHLPGAGFVDVARELSDPQHALRRE